MSQVPSGGSGRSPSARADAFPRTTDLPTQSPLYWVAEKDRYLRQLMIRDIQALTGRTLLVYFSTPDPRALIAAGDDVYFTEMLQDANGGAVDLMIETNGGFTDTTEKIAAVLRNLSSDLRVIVPARAKSNGTMLALVGSEIVMGPCSELGPADPLITIQPYGPVPAHFLRGNPGIDPVIQQFAEHAVLQTAKLAETLLTTGMMKGRSPPEISAAVDSLSTRNTYPSHGSVIDPDEAKRLGLNITKLDANDDLWKRLWLLRCMYEFDAVRGPAIKIFEGPQVSNRIRPPPA
jgi:hypothetical protein